MKRLIFISLILALATPVLAQGTYTGSQSPSIDKLSIEKTCFERSPLRAEITLYLERSNSEVAKGFVVTIVDGDDPNDPAGDNWLTGDGTGGEPVGLFATMVLADTNETGQVEARINKAVLRWLVTNRAALRAAGMVVDTTVDDVTVP